MAKKLLISLNPEMYKKYKGLQDYLDFITRKISEFNFDSDNTCEYFIEQISNVYNDTGNLEIRSKNEFEYEIIHATRKDIFGTITKINLI